MSWGPLGTLTETPSPVVGSEAGTKPFPWLQRVPGHNRVPTQGCHAQSGGQSCAGCLCYHPQPGPRVLLGLWASVRTKQHRKLLRGAWRVPLGTSPLTPFPLLPQQREVP